MAVYTEVSEAALAAFVARYGLGRLHGFQGITQGVENTNYRVDTERGRYLLTLYEKRVSTADLPFFLGLMEHLAKRGLNCPVPLHDRHGAVLGELSNRPAALVTWLEGAWPQTQSPAQCAALGTGLAELHLDGSGFTIKRANALGPADWRPLFERFATNADQITPGLRAAIAQELSYLDAHWPRELPHGVIHADLFPDNAFFVGDRLSGIIDFYFACNDLFAYDVAVCLNAWAFDAQHGFVPGKARALLEAYDRKRRLTQAEKTALPILARGAALRFLLTRAYDWLNTPATAQVVRKDPGEYLKKLAFFQSATSARALGIEG
jgi:homoserine kinase type II